MDTGMMDDEEQPQAEAGAYVDSTPGGLPEYAPDMPDYSRVIKELFDKLAEQQVQIVVMEAELARLREMPIPSGTGHQESPTPRFRVFPARLDTDTTFVEQVVVDDALVDSPAAQARTGDVIAPPADGATMLEVEDKDGQKFVQIAGSGGGLDYCILKNGTGVIGDSMSAATWVYDVYAMDGTTLIQAAVSPQQARSIGVTNKASDNSLGFGRKVSGDYKLAIALGEYRGKTPKACA